MMDFVLYIGRRGIKKIGGIFGVGIGDCCSVGEGFCLQSLSGAAAGLLLLVPPPTILRLPDDLHRIVF